MYPHTATLYDLVEAAGKSTYTSVGTSRCFLQPLTAEEAQRTGITFSKAFKCYFPHTTDIRAKMRVSIGSTSYSVSGLYDYGFGELDHKKAILEKLS